MQASSPSRKWLVLTALSAIGFIIGGSGAVVIGLLIDPLITEFHWSNGLTSSLPTAFNMTGLLAVPLCGALMDRFGPRAIMICGVVAFTAGLLLASSSHTYATTALAFALSGVGYFCAFYLPSTVIVAHWSGTQKGLGMGLVMSAMSVGAAVWSPLIGWSIETYGWRASLELVAACSALMLLLAVAATRTVSSAPTARDMPATGNIPAAGGMPTAAPSSERPQQPVSARNAGASLIFLAVIAASVLFNIGMGSILYHVVALLRDLGFSAETAASIYGATWLLSGVGSLLMGPIADRYDAKTVLAAALCACALGTFALLGASVDTGTGSVCVALFVLLWGASANSVSQFVPVIFAERFGQHRLGVLVGIQSAAAGISGSAAPILTGLLYDRFADYHLTIYLSSAVTLTASILLAATRTTSRKSVSQLITS